jgi:hypothetical protein
MTTSSKPMVAEVNCTTGVSVEREMTEAEFADYQVYLADAKVIADAEKIKTDALTNLKTSAKSKLVAGEPLTEEEAATIVL